MLVSAISANRTMTALNANYTFVNSRGNDITGDYTTNNQTPKSELDKVYASVNEWKHFCHKQIENGKLDIIA